MMRWDQELRRRRGQGGLMDAWKSSKKRMFSVTDDMQNLLLEGEIGLCVEELMVLYLSGVRVDSVYSQVIGFSL